MAKGGLTALAAKSQHHDPVLGALFSSSIGPVSRPPVSRYNRAKLEAKTKALKIATDDDEDESGEDLSSSGEEEEEGGDDDAEEDSEQEVDDDGETDESDSDANSADENSVVSADDAQANADAKLSRKRKRRDDTDDLEDRYLTKLAREEEAEHAAKKKKSKAVEPTVDAEPVDESPSDAGDDEIPVHESLDTEPTTKTDLEKASRTVFLSNVSITAATSGTDKKTLLAHLSTVLDTTTTPPEKIESIRFRSLPFSDGALPKRAAYITGALMDATTHSSNAYAVYSTAAAARRAVSKLNGTKVLDRHLRVDNVAHPSPTDHHRCVFVGNLAYIDDETIVSTGADGETTSKKRNKTPADVEEGLWRAFGQNGRRVENVRVPRDPKTRVGKGFAYIQFYNENDVESALLLDGRKFPPMLPRNLRVTRAKPPQRTALAMERASARKAGFTARVPNSGKYVPKLTEEQRTLEGRAGRLLGRSAVMKQRFGGNKRTARSSKGDGDGVVAEGRRASAKDGLPSGLKLGRPQRAKGAGRKAAMKSRGSKRAADWRKNKA